MNVVEVVAKALGVELEEEFYIKEEFGLYKGCGRYKITKPEGLVEYDIYVKDFIARKHKFELLIRGAINILKHEWVPQNGEQYYCITTNGCIRQDTYDCNRLTQHYRIQLGNYFRTKEEALKNVEAYLAYQRNPITSWRVK